MKKINAMFSWSGGKDSCFAAMQSIQLGYQPKAILNMLNENGRVSRSHGLPLGILKQQAEQLNLPLIAVPSSWEDYERKFIETLQTVKDSYEIDCAVFGDIDLEMHREWEEKVCRAAGISPLLPLWKKNRKELLLQMLDSGLECIIVSCNKLMGEKYLGRELTMQLADELETIGVDPCGENGEFHTLVTGCPLFKQKIELPDFGTATHNDYCFIIWE